MIIYEQINYQDQRFADRYCAPHTGSLQSMGNLAGYQGKHTPFDAVGVSRQTINFIETGRYMPSTVVALKIARYFGRHADEIFQLEEND